MFTTVSLSRLVCMCVLASIYLCFYLVSLHVSLSTSLSMFNHVHAHIYMFMPKSLCINEPVCMDMMCYCFCVSIFANVCVYISIHACSFLYVWHGSCMSLYLCMSIFLCVYIYLGISIYICGEFAGKVSWIDWANLSQGHWVSLNRQNVFPLSVVNEVSRAKFISVMEKWKRWHFCTPEHCDYVKFVFAICIGIVRRNNIREIQIWELVKSQKFRAPSGNIISCSSWLIPELGQYNNMQDPV